MGTNLGRHAGSVSGPRPRWRGTYLREGKASSTWSDALARISHTQVTLSCMSLRGGFLTAPEELVMTPPHGGFSKGRRGFRDLHAPSFAHSGYNPHILSFLSKFRPFTPKSHLQWPSLPWQPTGDLSNTKGTWTVSWREAHAARVPPRATEPVGGRGRGVSRRRDRCWCGEGRGTGLEPSPTLAQPSLVTHTDELFKSGLRK